VSKLVAGLAALALAALALWQWDWNTSWLELWIEGHAVLGAGAYTLSSPPRWY